MLHADELKRNTGNSCVRDTDGECEVESCFENKYSVFNDGHGPRWAFWRRKRFTVLIMIFLGEIVKAILRSNFSIAVFTMTENYTMINENGTKIQDFDWDVKTRGFLLSVFYYGYLSTSLLGGILAVKYGGCRLYGLGIVLASSTTLISPFAARLHLYLFIALRIFEGMSEGFLNPCLELLLARWIPKEERISCASVAATGNIWGHCISVALSSAIGYHLGWEAIFYCTGVTGLVWFLVWLITVKEYPKLDKKITLSERYYIEKSYGKTPLLNRKLSSIPFMKIITSLPVWSFTIAFIATMSFYIATITHLPAYIKDVLELEYQNSGYLSILPVIVSVLIAYLVSPVADIMISKNILSVTATRKVHVCGSLMIMATCGFLIKQAASATSVIACLTIMQTFNTVSQVQFTANVIDIAGEYTSVLSGFMTTTISLCGMFVPTVIGYLTQNKTAKEWHWMFGIQSGICMLGAFMYGVFASGELQPWAVEKRKQFVYGEAVITQSAKTNSSENEELNKV